VGGGRVFGGGVISGVNGQDLQDWMIHRIFTDETCTCIKILRHHGILFIL
jgi:hypothetical protein